MESFLVCVRNVDLDSGVWFKYDAIRNIPRKMTV